MIRLAAVLSLLCLTVAFGEELRGKVVKIADGDTISVLDADKVQHKILLEGIDAPEKGQAFDTKSRESLGKKVCQKEVLIVWEKKDRYSRILGMSTSMADSPPRDTSLMNRFCPDTLTINI